MREGNDDQPGGDYFIKVIEKRLLINWIISHVKVFMYNVSLGNLRLAVATSFAVM